MSDRRVMVALLTQLEPMQEVEEPGYERAITQLAFGPGMQVRNTTTAWFRSSLTDWPLPVIGFATYGVPEDGPGLLFSGPINEGKRQVKAGETLSFPPGSLVLEIYR